MCWSGDDTDCWHLDTDAVVLRFYEILEEIDERGGDFYGVYQDYIHVDPDSEEFTMPGINIDYTGSAGLLGFCVEHSDSPEVGSKLEQLVRQPELAL